jgi:hypothetical protein
MDELAFAKPRLRFLLDHFSTIADDRQAWRGRRGCDQVHGSTKFTEPALADIAKPICERRSPPVQDSSYELLPYPYSSPPECS